MSPNDTSYPADQAVTDAGCSPADHLARGGDLRDILPFSEADDESLYALGYMLYGQALYAQAMPIFALLVARNVADPRFAIAYAACLQMQDRHELAMGYYMAASMQDPTNPAPLYHTCECLIATGHPGPARQGLDLVQEIGEAARDAALLKKARGLRALIDAADQSSKEGGRNDQSSE